MLTTHNSIKLAIFGSKSVGKTGKMSDTLAYLRLQTYSARLIVSS